MRRRQQTLKSLSLFAVALIGAMALVGIARRGAAQSNDCLAVFQDVPTADENGGSISCNDCDPACDQDGMTTPNQACTINFRACVNVASSSCAAGTIKKLQEQIDRKVEGKNCAVTWSSVRRFSSLAATWTPVLRE